MYACAPCTATILRLVLNAAIISLLPQTMVHIALLNPKVSCRSNMLFSQEEDTLSVELWSLSHVRIHYHMHATIEPLEVKDGEMRSEPRAIPSFQKGDVFTEYIAG